MIKPLLKVPDYPSEGVRIHGDLGQSYPVEVFGDHSFCAGKSMKVYAMAGPHMHSQVELNFLLKGSMTYWFDGREVTLSAGRLAVFWGMIPHQVLACEDDTRFVVLYVPMSAFIELPALSRLREAIFRGALIEALEIKPYDSDMFQRWREDLQSGGGWTGRAGGTCVNQCWWRASTQPHRIMTGHYGWRKWRASSAKRHWMIFRLTTWRVRQTCIPIMRCRCSSGRWG
jgi:mannose-6-phosphate isomerase-like protein (cupin superfamily)